MNEARLKLANIAALNHQARILIINSQLNKAEFSSINFKQYSLIVLGDSDFTQCSFNHVTWSENVLGAIPVTKQEETPEKHKIFELKSRETYRQLKHAMSKQGDVINEQKFHSKEMICYLNGLGKGSLGTKLIIAFSYWTSDFGQSIGRPLLWLFSLHSVLFLVLLGCSNVFDFQFSNNFNSQAFGMGFNKYFYLMNPIRKFEEGGFYGGWIIIDILMRIISSYMIYNIVRATRRFIK
ncbi:hypothetical protein MKQ70_30525 [Chitinophaga sedimenti]|uniref:hypothetical protein n=1 Tax=Chitinophaga sedimenti TaxID=2033606 RepID=UPI002004DE15|nr:hypothetical protein [Chitinophaga sedimenti]MCK7559080.1 hypothetical protein [Chitinophaga sedimenti]